MESTIMKYELNPLTHNYLCWIPGTDQAYYYNTLKQAIIFCEKVNNAFKTGKLSIIENHVIKN